MRCASHLVLALVCVQMLMPAIVEGQMKHLRMRMGGVAAAAPSSGITCAQLGVTCVVESSFTSAQGWTSPPYTQWGNGAPDCATFPGAPGSGSTDLTGQQTGFSNAGGEDTSGYCDQVSTDANYASGAGGAGFRHWRGDGSNAVGGGITVTPPSAVTHLWVRNFMRHQSGFAWSPSGSPSYEKDHYWNGPGCTANDCIIFGIQGSNSWGINHDNMTNHNSSRTWTASQGGVTGDGLWHCYEYEVFKNGTGASILRIWIDGTQYLNSTTIDLGTGTLADLVIGENQTTVTGAGSTPWYTDYDDFAISNTSRIGGTGCGG